MFKFTDYFKSSLKSTCELCAQVYTFILVFCHHILLWSLLPDCLKVTASFERFSALSTIKSSLSPLSTIDSMLDTITCVW